jgi:NAD(P)-dependent dehydrogenase (short-subunit alcohol dehydrogenase family)
MLLGDIDEKGLQKTRDDVVRIHSGVDVDVVRLDVSNEASVQDFIDRCVERFGRVDYACNIAGICPSRTPTIDVEPEVFDRVVHTNLYGVSGLKSTQSTGADRWLCRLFFAIVRRSDKC